MLSCVITRHQQLTRLSGVLCSFYYIYKSHILILYIAVPYFIVICCLLKKVFNVFRTFRIIFIGTTCFRWSDMTWYLYSSLLLLFTNYNIYYINRWFVIKLIHSYCIIIIYVEYCAYIDSCFTSSMLTRVNTVFDEKYW